VQPGGLDKNGAIMKTNNQNTDKQLALHNIQELRQRLTAAPSANDQTRGSGAAPSDSASGLSSASGFMGA